MDVSTRVTAVRGPSTALGDAVAVGGTTAATALLLLFRGDVSKTNVVLAFLLVVVAAAATGGVGPGLVASAVGFLAFDEPGGPGVQERGRNPSGRCPPAAER